MPVLLAILAALFFLLSITLDLIAPQLSDAMTWFGLSVLCLVGFAITLALNTIARALADIRTLLAADRAAGEGTAITSEMADRLARISEQHRP